MKLNGGLKTSRLRALLRQVLLADSPVTVVLQVGSASDVIDDGSLPWERACAQGAVCLLLTKERDGKHQAS
jgi:hypothetical protein